MGTRRAVAGTSGKVRARSRFREARGRLAAIPEPRRLCLGSGDAPIEGWVNVDLVPPADVILDLRLGIPAADASIDAIYSEHLIEHFTLEDGMRLLAECHRVLKPHGRLRFATPDLEDIARDYQTGWRRHDWVRWPEYDWIDSGARMLNTALRGWGHVYVYDFSELDRRLREVGFGHVERCELGRSASPELCGLETRLDSGLIVEAMPVAPDATT